MDKCQYTRRKHGLEYLWYLNIDTPEAKQLRDNLQTGRYREVENLIDSLKDTNDRMYYLEAAADWKKTPEFLDRWFQSNSPTSNIVSLIHSTKRSFRFWTNRASDIELFNDELKKADEGFSKHAFNFPNDASHFYWHIWVARALGTPAHARDLFNESFSRAPENKANASVSINTEGPQWFGSKIKLYEYTKFLLPQLPSGIGASSLLIEAHYLNQLEEEPDISNYSSEKELRDDIIFVFDSCTNEGFRGSTGIRSLHYLAWGLSRINEHKLAKQIFQQINGSPPGSPWGSYKFGLDAIFSSYRSARKKSFSAR